MTDYFLFDPAYKDFPLKGKFRFSTVYGGQYRFIGMTLLTIVALLGIILLFVLLAPQELRFLQESVRKRGFITQACSSTSDKFTYVYEVSDNDGNVQAYSGKGSPGKNQTCPKVGDRILVEYLPSEPQTSRATSAGVSNSSYVGIMCLGLLFIMSCLFMEFTNVSAYLQARKRYKRFQNATTEIEGKVVAIYGREGISVHDAFTYLIYADYEFELNNRRYQGQQIKHRGDLGGLTLPPVGTPVRVLYADDEAFVML